jgi:hypothetical protein
MSKTALVRRCSKPVALLGCAVVFCSSWCSPAKAQGTATPPNALNRILSLNLPRLEGTIPAYYSEGLKALALHDQAEIADCASWYSKQLHVSVPVTLAVLNEADWNRVGQLAGYPMAEAFPEEGNIIIMPDSFAKFPGQNKHVDLNKKLSFIAMHETGHLYQRAVHLEGPDLFMQECFATMLATAYSSALRPELISDTLDSRTGTKQRYTSFEDMDLIYDGVGFDNYDWLQVETVRLAVFFVKGQNIAELVRKSQAAFPAGQAMSNREVFRRLEVIRPGITALAGALANPTTLEPIVPAECFAAPRKGNGIGHFGVLNASDHGITVVDDGVQAVLPPGYTAEQGSVGTQFKLPSGRCITYSSLPGYIVLK